MDDEQQEQLEVKNRSTELVVKEVKSALSSPLTHSIRGDELDLTNELPEIDK